FADPFFAQLGPHQPFQPFLHLVEDVAHLIGGQPVSLGQGLLTGPFSLGQVVVTKNREPFQSALVLVALTQLREDALPHSVGPAPLEALFGRLVRRRLVGTFLVSDEAFDAEALCRAARLPSTVSQDSLQHSEKETAEPPSAAVGPGDDVLLLQPQEE